MIVQAALKIDGKIWKGCNKCRHSDLIKQYIITTENVELITNEMQGFLTDDGTFLNRKQAAEHAYINGQIPEQQETLISEDLW